MLALLCSWLILVLVFLSWGSMSTALWSGIAKMENKLTLFDTFWIGICTVGVLLSILSIFIPLSFSILIGFVGVSVVYTLWNRQAFIQNLSKIAKQIGELPLWAKLGWGIAFVAISLFALTTPLLYDEGLYHLQTMLWSEQYSVIPGLGNLHGRLAFNSNFLLLSTLFNYHPNNFFTFFSINSLSLLVFATWTLIKVSRSKNLVERVIMILVLLLCIFSFGIYLSSTSTDILAHIIVIYLLLTCVMDKDALKDRVLLFFVLPIFCITLKLSSALIGLMTLFVFIQLIRNKDYRIVYSLIGMGFMIGLPWLARFVILSGYLVYPFPAIDIFSFDWKIPIELVQLEKDLAYVWPIASDMNPNEVLAMSPMQWVPIWLKQQSVFILSLYTLVLVSPIVLLVRYNLWKQNAVVLLAWAIAFLGCIFGFLTAPDPRFSFGFIICAGLIPFLLFASLFEDNTIIRKLALLSPVILFVGLIGLIYIGYGQTKHYQAEDKPMYTLLWKPQDIDYKKLERASIFQEYKIEEITFHYPDNSNQCFDQPLPCIPHPNDRLEPRGKGIEDGFRIAK